jgi:hypothetical protein
MTFPLHAVQHVRRMRGGAQAHLLRASDEKFYVTKFSNNPQHTRVLANEMFASLLGRWLGLPMPDVAVIEVYDWLLEHSPELCFENIGQRTKCSHGRQFASLYACDPQEEIHLDYLPDSMFFKVRNVADFARVLVLDKWTGNADGRQAVFSKKAKQRLYTATFIDQGYCFNAGEWDFPDSPLRGVYARNCVYTTVTGWDAFEPALTKVEQAEPMDIWRCAQVVPSEWYDHDSYALETLVETMYERRLKIRDLITAFRKSTRQPFPGWTATGQISCSRDAHPKSARLSIE